MLSNAMNSEMKRVYVFCWIHRCCILRTFDAAAISRINCCAAGTMLLQSVQMLLAREANTCSVHYLIL
jgi:hypothetical protein